MEIKRFIGGNLEANCYVISADRKNEGGKCLIIDPGYNPKDIIKHIRGNGYEAVGIILTHHHYDHSGGAGRIRKELECPVMIHAADADSYAEGADVLLQDGDVIELPKSECKSEKIRVLHTPGHTKGGICLFSEESRVCFCGDTVFNVDLGRTDLEDGDEQEMRNSIKNVVNRWGNEITIYPGHGDPASMKTVRRINHEFMEIINGN